MFTKEDILARLQNGDSMDEIAKEMSDALNAAGAEYEEAKQADNRVMDAKRVAVDGMLDCLCDFLVAAGEEDLVKSLEDVETDVVVDMIDSAIELTKTLDKLSNLEFVKMPTGLKFPKVEHECGSGACECDMPKVSVKVAEPADVDMVIKSFLKGI